MKKIIKNLSNAFQDLAIEAAYNFSAEIYWGSSLNEEYELPGNHELVDAITDRLIEGHINDLIGEIRNRLADKYSEEELDDFINGRDFTTDFREGVLRYCLD